MTVFPAPVGAATVTFAYQIDTSEVSECVGERERESNKHQTEKLEGREQFAYD
jgi:hypothetical protein